MELDTGVCVSCLLLQGLETDGEVSKAVYETVLDEVDARDKSWQLGNYEILEQIGCGGMGVIYRARQRHSRRVVAVKRVLSYRADSHGALQRFRREAEAVARLDHPNILPIYEVSESEDGLPFFSMKLAQKGSLLENAAFLREQPRKCVELMAKVTRAVEFAHSRGVLHRDIKPGNILLNERGEPLVSDFGLAKLLDGNNDLTRSLTTFGTAGFIAPEQANGAAADVTPAADVYSLGAVLFDVLAGRPPFVGSNPVSVIRQASETQAPKLRTLAPSLDRDLETICARCLERDPKARYQSAADLAADLERWLDGRPIVARPVAVPARMWRWSRRNPKLVGAATAGLLLGAAGVWLLRDEFFRAPQFNPPQRSIAVLPFTDPSITQPIGMGRLGIRLPVQNPSNPFPVPDYTSAGNFDPTRPETHATAAPPRAEVTTSMRDSVSEAGSPTNKIAAAVTAAPPENVITTSMRDRVSEAGLRTNKITADGPASIQGVVKDAKGEPIRGTDVRIESRDGKQVFSTVKTDSKGRYVSHGLQPGVYRVTLLVNGAVSASIMNTQTKANQATELNFELMPPAKGKKRMVWAPARTGSHISGTWVEVDEGGEAHSGLNIQTLKPGTTSQ
jgi:serine/threonine protein kinase